MDDIISSIISLENQKRAPLVSRYFQNFPWWYGYPDKFLGLSVPQIQSLAKQFRATSLENIKELIHNDYHEVRLIWYYILLWQYQKTKSQETKKGLISFYLNNLEWTNNWDLVDAISYKLLWDYLLDQPKELLYDLAKSENIWIRRISIITTMAFIRKWMYDDTLALCQVLLSDTHSLIHKATWWMLREIWKRDQQRLLGFLNNFYTKMPRTMLRYAIERLSPEQKIYYMKK